MGRRNFRKRRRVWCFPRSLLSREIQTVRKVYARQRSVTVYKY